jgi:hypothetical protein
LILIILLPGAAYLLWSEGDERPKLELELELEDMLGLGEGVSLAIPAAGGAAEEDELDDAAAVFEPEG